MKTKPITKRDHADMLATLRKLEGRRVRVLYRAEGQSEPRPREGVLTDAHAHTRLGHPLFRVDGSLLACLDDRLVGIETLEWWTTDPEDRDPPGVSGVEQGEFIGKRLRLVPDVGQRYELCWREDPRVTVRQLVQRVEDDATARRARSTALKLTREQRAQVRSLVDDSGYSREEARALVLAGGFVP